MHRLSRSVGAWRSVPRAVVVALAVVGCVGPPAPPALDDAHAAVERARSAPRVRALAPAELDLAEIALEQAAAAARAGAPRAAVEHLAYVASQRAAFAEARAAAQVARSDARLLRRALAQNAIEARREDQRSRPRSHEDPGPPAPPADDRPQTTAADEGLPAAEPDALTGAVAAFPNELTLSLAELPFEQAEPTEKALVAMAGMAERMRRQPWRTLRIEAEFDLPEPEARTLMERRVEVVRAFFLERGVAPARLVVQATGDSRLRPPAVSFVDPTEGAPAIIDGPHP
jgi:outer membrane protein OmpA-like peptidoglycan-associated protein